MSKTAVEKHRVPIQQMSVEATLPEDWEEGAFVGRVWRPEVKGPAVVTLAEDGFVYDITSSFSTVSKLLEEKAPAAAARRAQRKGEKLGPISEILAQTQCASTRHPTLLAPIDLQAIKAAGVTFAVSLVERLVEEKCKGDARKAPEIRARIQKELGGRELSELEPGSPEALRIKDYLIKELGFAHHYLEVGLGTMGEVFTKAQPMSAVGHGSPAGLHPESAWNNPEPEMVLALSSKGRLVGATLGNDVNLRDIEGKSALLLGECKDQRASCAVGPLLRLFDRSFTLAQACTMDVGLHIRGKEGFELEDISSMRKISRAPARIVRQMFCQHDYPDGAVLFCGTMFSPAKPRGKHPGFTHQYGDMVTIRSDKLGALTNVMVSTAIAPKWQMGTRALMENLAQRGLLIDRNK